MAMDVGPETAHIGRMDGNMSKKETSNHTPDTSKLLKPRLEIDLDGAVVVVAPNEPFVSLQASTDSDDLLEFSGLAEDGEIAKTVGDVLGPDDSVVGFDQRVFHLLDVGEWALFRLKRKDIAMMEMGIGPKVDVRAHDDP